MNSESHLCLEDRQTYKYMFTVFTPTYNREHTLHRVYKSLKMQTYRDFEWLIFDDGSTDNTRNLIEKWQQDNHFPIRYLYSLDNIGLNLAHNRGVMEAKGELFLQLDSDDACVPNALEQFKFNWDSIPVNLKHQFSAVTCLCRDENGKLVGNYFPFNPTDSDSLEIRYRFKVKGEKWGFHRTEVVRQFLYPETLEKGTHLSENFKWNQIARCYKTRFINDILRIYWVRSDSNSLVKSKPNAFNKQLYLAMVLNKEIDYFPFSPLTFLLNAAHYSRFSFHIQCGIFKQIKLLHPVLSRIICLTCLPLGYLLFMRDKFIYDFQK
jgi:glycosyltransferase involved in cell wall biosynthesis